MGRRRELKDFHEQMIKKQGELETVNKTIEELQELTNKLNDWKTLFYIGAVDSIDMRNTLDHVQEERVDCSVMLKRLDKLFNFTKQENKNIAVTKINRTIDRYLL